jgi:UDP-N-acetylglucosamine/UDP-N-acetylgalactosamine diphosphorylase
MVSRDSLEALLAPQGQQHLLAFWEQLDAEGQSALAAQIAQLDFALIARLYAQRDQLGDFRQLVERAGPPPAVRLDVSRNRFAPHEARRRGRQALEAGQVGAILVAGGQGTRLGFPQPKGMYPIGPVSGRTLFEVHADKLVATAARYGVRIPLYVMTSPATHEPTVEFFARHGRFGLLEEDLRIFCQGTMPAVDAASGRVLLAAPGRLATSPNGHGGMLAALVASGALEDARRRGLRQLFYFQVDNPLVEICSAEFLGYHLLAGSEMTSQVIAKRHPLDRLGNVVEVDGRLMVIEYSDLPEEAARRRNPDGSLAIWAGSIAVHVFEVEFLRRMAAAAESLPFHLAHKKVACVEAGGRRIEPTEANAIQFERFIFDLLPSAQQALVVEVDPAAAFAPLKNAPGAKEDTPESVQAQMVAQHRQWLVAAGVAVDHDTPVEISPHWALDAAEVARKVRPGTRLTQPTYLKASSLL